MGPHTLGPWGTLVFHWFYKGSSAEPCVPSWGSQPRHLSLGDATLRVSLAFPRVLTIPGWPCSEVFFGQAGLARNHCFYNGFEGFRAEVFLARFDADGP